MALTTVCQWRAFLWQVTGLVALLGLYCGDRSWVPAVAAETTMVMSQEAGVSPRATAFMLKDQYDKQWDYRFPRETISVMFFADYTGSEQVEDWVRPLYDCYAKTIGIYGVADLSAVPGFMRGLVAQFFRTQLQYPVMFDWHGTVSRSYAAQGGQANLYLIDTEGRIVLRLVGAVSPERLGRVMAQIDRLVRSD